MSEDLAIIEDAELVQAPAANLFGVSDPEAVIERATAVARSLKDVIEKAGLVVNIQGNKHPQVEAWTLLGSMLGVFPVCTWTRKLEDPEGWEARVEARTRSGEIIGAAEAQCTRKEAMWSHNPPKGKPRDDYALRSMAQTRATSRALRQPLGFVMTLGGYNPTPAEEMPSGGAESARNAPEAPASVVHPGEEMITDAQHAKIGVLIKELNEKAPPAEGQNSWVEESRRIGKVRSRTELTKAAASDVIEWLSGQLEAAEIPL